MLGHLFREDIPGVFSCPLLTPNATKRLRDNVNLFSSSGIPTRRPNGMNRHGSILEANVDGGIAGFDNFLDGLVDRFVRPFAESLFPANVGPGDSKGRFIFTVKYEHHAEEEGTPRRVYDIKLAEHRDAWSLIT